MTWTLEGTYFENCSCDTICPCTWSGLTAPATKDRCKAMLAFHIDRGDIEGVDVGGLSFAMVIDTPPVMSDGGWKLGVVMDGAASEQQTGALGRVLGGELGGPPAMLGPLIGEMLGVEQAPAEWRQSDGTFAVRFGELIDVEVESYTGEAGRAGAAHERLPSGQHHLDGVAGHEIEGRRLRHHLRRHRHQRIQRAVRLVGMTAPAAPVAPPAFRLRR